MVMIETLQVMGVFILRFSETPSTVTKNSDRHRKLVEKTKVKENKLKRKEDYRKDNTRGRKPKDAFKCVTWLKKALIGHSFQSVMISFKNCPSLLVCSFQ